MPLPRFSEALALRRQELGLSLSQASRTLKLREDVLDAFERGDFEHMPQSGYAQGMLSSYARYLGLNAREIVDLFQEELYEYHHGTSSHELQRRTRQTRSGRGLVNYDVPNEAGSRPKAYVEYRPLLPTSGGPAGDMGDFATTAPVRPRGSSVPLAGSTIQTTRSHSSTGSSRPYNQPTTHERSTASTARRRPPSSRRRSDDKASRLLSERQYRSSEQDAGRSGARTGRLYLRDDVSTRRVDAGEYTDDLRLDERPRPYASAATASGRRSSRNIAQVERPNVRRRSSRSRSQGSSRNASRGGTLSRFFSDPSRALFAIIILLAVVLTAIITFSVSSCVSGRSQVADTTTQTVPVQSTTASDDDASSDDGASSDDAAADDDTSGSDAADDGASAAADDDAAEDEETVVEVSVEQGSVSWVEITCDGTSEIAESVTGPWSQSYTVTDSITIQVSNPDAVTVTENGEPVEFSQRAGGLGSVTIEGTPAADDASGSDASQE